MFVLVLPSYFKPKTNYIFSRLGGKVLLYVGEQMQLLGAENIVRLLKYSHAISEIHPRPSNR